MSLLPKRQPGAALSRNIVKDTVETLVDEGLYQPVLDENGRPGLIRTAAGKAAGMPEPLSDPRRG